ncbi:MAG: NAD(P)/FAD-dependent oxidoreductase [Dehalococcoidia bacterium]
MTSEQATEAAVDYQGDNFDVDVIVIGAGAAGVGLGVVLGQLGVPRYGILERYEVGASFRRWPKEMRFITPSFPSNSFGVLDLNAVAVGTSPGFSLDSEHPAGAAYAAYLERVAEYFEQPITTGVEVHAVTPLPEGGFDLETTNGPVRSGFVVWAGGEFQNPVLGGFPGADLCVHNSSVVSFAELPGDEAYVIGGYESGIDAATALWLQGKRVTLFDARARWSNESSDPSISLSPYTKERLQTAQRGGRIELVGETRIARVSQDEAGFTLEAEDGRSWRSATRPILATGFRQVAAQHPELWNWREDGLPELSEHDESTRTPGLFLVGPGVRHEEISFCFIYKFRQRFAVVAAEIGRRMGLDLSYLEFFRKNQMWLDDLSCCTADCVC